MKSTRSCLRLAIAVLASALAFDARCDQPPRIVVTAPLSSDVVLKRVWVDAACEDEQPSSCTITARVDATTLSGLGRVAGWIYVEPHPEQPYTLPYRWVEFSARDAAGQVSSATVSFIHDASHLLQPTGEIYPGRIEDFDATHVLYGNTLVTRADGHAVELPASSASRRLLTSVGVLSEFAGFPEALTSWESGTTVNLGPSHGAAVARQFIAWTYDGDVFRRDLGTGTNSLMNAGRPATSFVMAPDGSVAFSSGAGIYIAKTPGSPRLVTSDSRFSYRVTQTDGESVAFMRRATGNDPYILYEAVIQRPAGETVLGDGTSPFFAGDWEMYQGPRFSSRDPTHIRIRLRGGSWQERYTTGIPRLADASGALVIGERVPPGLDFAYPGQPFLHLANYFAFLRVIDGVPHVASGNTLLRVQVHRPHNDLDGDGRSDVAWFNTATRRFYRSFMDGKQIIHGEYFQQAFGPPGRVEVPGDFDGDGVGDLAFRRSDNGQVILLSLDAAGREVQRVVHTEPDPNWRIVAASDLNGDGRDDLVWRHDSTGQVSFVDVGATPGPGTSNLRIAVVYRENDPAWRIVAGGDFSGTGVRNQLLWHNLTSGEVYLQTAKGDWTNGFTLAGEFIQRRTAWYWKIVDAADFDGDGKADILWHNDLTGEVYLMKMDGPRIVEQRTIYHEPNLDWRIQAAGDYDGDGKADLLWRNASTGEVYLMPVDGFTVRDGAVVYREADPEWLIIGPRTSRH